MAETSTSPGYYGTEIYSYINELDPTFKDDVSPQEFLDRLQDEEYAGKIYAYLAGSDETFVEDLSLDDFVSNVKKKKSPPLRSLYRTMVHRSYYPLLRSRRVASSSR